MTQKKKVEKVEVVVEKRKPTITGGASKSLKILMRRFPKSVQKMMQAAEKFAKGTEKAMMNYDVQIDKKTGEAFRPKKETKQAK